jgi:hypothetical protein
VLNSEAARHKLAAGSPFHTILPNTQGTRISLLLIDPAQSTFELLTQARKTIAHQRNPAPATLGLACFGLDAKQAERASEALIAAALAADFSMPDFKSKREPGTPLKQIRIYGHKAAHATPTFWPRHAATTSRASSPLCHRMNSRLATTAAAGNCARLRLEDRISGQQ